MYAVLRRRRLPAWGAALATTPVLLNATFLQIEHAVLSDTLFVFLVAAAVTALLWSQELSTRGAAGAGLLMAMAACTRTIALPLLILTLLYLLVCRVGVRRIAAFAATAATPLLLYATWYDHEYGRFTLAGVTAWRCGPGP